MSSPPDARTRSVALVVVAALTVGFVVWLFTHGDDDDKPAASQAPAVPAKAVPVEATGGTLRQLARETAYPVYWAGRVPRRKVELSHTTSGGIYIRYLANDVALGDPQPKYLTVATYPLPDAWGALKQAAAQPGNTTTKLRGGMVVAAANATSAFYSRPRSAVQVEVFDPQPGRARELLTRGRINAIRR